jgi:hypothetical protein
MPYNLIAKNYNSTMSLAHDYYCANNPCENRKQDNLKILTSSIKKLFWTLSGSEFLSIVRKCYDGKDYEGIFVNNYKILSSKFEQINNDNVIGSKVTLYASSILDHNGYLLSFPGMMAQLNTVHKLQEAGFTVYPHLVSSKKEIDQILIKFKTDKIGVDLIMVAAHGESDKILLFDSYIDIKKHVKMYEEQHVTSNYATTALYSMIWELSRGHQSSSTSLLNKNSFNLKFPSLKKEYDIVFYSCSLAKGKDSFALNVAKQNPAAHVFAADKMVFFSDLVLSQDPTKDSHYVQQVQYHKAILGIFPAIGTTEMKEFFAGKEENYEPDSTPNLLIKVLEYSFDFISRGLFEPLECNQEFVYSALFDSCE